MAKPPTERVEGAFFRGGSSVFRAVNFELFASPSKPVAILGSVLLLISVGIVANIEPKPKPRARRREDELR